MKIEIILMVMTLSMALSAHSGLKALTIHSRANCVNNESITWHAGHPSNLYTWTQHYHYVRGNLDRGHVYDTGWQTTWRSAAVCWSEGYGGWKVRGSHYIKNASNLTQWLGDTAVSDCSIYNGWWD